MASAYIQIRKGQLTSVLKNLGIKNKYHNKLCEIAKEQIIKQVHNTMLNVGTAFIIQDFTNKEINKKLNPQKRLNI